MSRIDRMVSAIDPAAGSAVPVGSRGMYDLLEEIVATQPHAPRAHSGHGRHLLAGAVLAGIAATALMVVPLATGARSPAYAVTRQSDGAVLIKINELRDPGSLERDLAALGVPARIRYTPFGMMCSRDFRTADEHIPQDEFWSRDPEAQAEVRRKMNGSASELAYDLEPGGRIRVHPDRIGPGQTAVMEFSENPDQTSGPDKPRVLWSFSFALAVGPVGDCVLSEVAD